MKANRFSLRRMALVLTVVVLVVAVVSSSFLYLNFEANLPKKLSPIAVGNVPIEVNALVYVAETQGFFKQNGLDIEVSSYDTGVAAVNALLKGNVDIAFATEYPLVGLAFKNENVQTIGGLDKAETMFLVGRHDHGLENVSDLKGKTIAILAGTVGEFYLGRFLSLNGISQSDVTVLSMTVSQSEDALLSGTVDASVTYQPRTNAVVGTLGSNSVVWSIQGGQQGYWLMVCRKDWIAKNSALVKEFLNSLLKAEEFVQSNPAQAKTIVKNQLNFTDAYMETVWKQNQFSLSLDQSLVTALESEARWMINSKLTDQTAVPDFLNYLYLEGLNSIKPESVSIIR